VRNEKIPLIFPFFQRGILKAGLKPCPTKAKS